MICESKFNDHMLCDTVLFYCLVISNLLISPDLSTRSTLQNSDSYNTPVSSRGLVRTVHKIYQQYFKINVMEIAFYFLAFVRSDLQEHLRLRYVYDLRQCLKIFDTKHL